MHAPKVGLCMRNMLCARITERLPKTLKIFTGNTESTVHRLGALRCYGLVWAWPARQAHTLDNVYTIYAATDQINIDSRSRKLRMRRILRFNEF